MAICGFMESTIATSEIFNDMNDVVGNSGANILQKCLNLVKEAKHLTNEDVEMAYITVKQMSDSLTKEALKAFDSSKVILLYNTDKSKSVTNALPFITLKSRSGFFQTFVFVDKYITLSRDGVMNMSASIFRDLLIGGLISNSLKNNYNQLSSNGYLQKTLMDLYTKFVIRILNRQFAIIPDKVASDTVQYWVNKFFLINIMGANTTSEGIENLSCSHFRAIDEIKKDEITRQYNDTNPTKFSQLLELIKTASSRMRNLNKAIFLNEWISYYSAPSMFAIDTIEYLIFMILTLQSGNNIISIASSDIVKEQKGIKAFREELLKLI